jgi:NADPH2:quinone reductase
MKAAFIEATGGPEVIRYGDLPEPNLGPNQALVRVNAAAVNPIDTYIRSGTVAMALPKPFIIGCDLAGTVVAVASATGRFKPGDRVWGSNQGLLGRQGTFAELAVVDERWLYPIPPSVTDEQAAAAALTGITAHLGLFQWARLQPGETVYVSGGAGGVGSMAVQMAKANGAMVITTVGSAAKAERVRHLGADWVINYKSEVTRQRIAECGGDRGIDVWFETQREPDFPTILSLMARRGRIVVIAGRQAQPVLPLGQFYPKDLSLLGFAMFNASPEEQRVCADDINRWLSAGKLTVLIGETFTLRDAAAAHRLQEENTLGGAGALTGKIVVKP